MGHNKGCTVATWYPQMHKLQASGKPGGGVKFHQCMVGDECCNNHITLQEIALWLSIIGEGINKGWGKKGWGSLGCLPEHPHGMVTLLNDDRSVTHDTDGYSTNRFGQLDHE